MEYNKIITEEINPDTKNIDNVSTIEMVEIINAEDKKVAYAVEKELPAIAKAIDIISNKLSKGGRLIYIGAGTSGRLGILDASECPPTFGVSKDLVQGLIAGGHKAIFEAVEGAEDNKELASEDLKNMDFSSKDVIVGIAASGRTPYTIGGLEYGNSIGAYTISITNNPNSKMSKIANLSIAPIVGPEVISGSTRLKSGTSQKMVLNMLTTGSMIKLGKVYENLMVDVVAQNLKLIERSKKLVSLATGVSNTIATEYLEKTEYNVKLAILLIKTGLSVEEGRVLLEKNQGYLRRAIEES
ncbi:MAG TPA: N-acetylmuramic acid 6-phosphate etherase [Tissierellales bacterium]|nr:N-acetylmuramic acid 6-phosphate etherase [Tissierellales bacterium]